jgi:hypothetical protein
VRDLGIADRLRGAGLEVVEVDGWQTRGADTLVARGGVDHHTAGAPPSYGNAPSLEICTFGRPDLAGPLCQVLQGYDGTCYVIASGKANHAGNGGWRGLSGNSSVYGIERENDGYAPPQPGQHEAAAVAWSALLTDNPYGPIDAGMVCGHKEWTNQKIDFHDLDYEWFRYQIGEPRQEGDPMAGYKPKQLGTPHVGSEWTADNIGPDVQWTPPVLMIYESGFITWVRDPEAVDKMIELGVPWLGTVDDWVLSTYHYVGGPT